MSVRIAKSQVATALVACLGAALAPTVLAKQSDRNQPMNIDAGSQSGALDDSGPTILSGGVTIRQGTMDIRSNRAEISMNSGGDPTRALLTGSPVVLKQQMDDGTPMTARASKVDYNLQTEIVVFTGSVRIEQPRGDMSGERVVYNLKTGRVESGGEGAGRVKMTIQPKAARGGTSTQGSDGKQD